MIGIFFVIFFDEKGLNLHILYKEIWTIIFHQRSEM